MRSWKRLLQYGKTAPQVYTSCPRDDRALAVSKRVWGDVSRLGAIDPEQAPYKDELAANQIMVIDLTEINAGDQLHHSKFAESPEIVQLIGSRLSTGQTLSDSRVGIGDTIVTATAGAAHSVGTATGLVLAAPAAIVDQNSRQNFNAHLETVTSPTN